MPTPAHDLPAPVRLARILLALIAISHLVVPVVMWAGQSSLRDQIASQHREFSAAEVIRSADVALAAAAGFHAVLMVLCAVLAWQLGTARPWTRRLTTVSQLLAIVFSVFSWSSAPMFHPVIPVIGAAQLLTVALLWLPTRAKTFFATGANAQSSA